MITAEEAKRHIAGLQPDRLRELTKQRLLGEDSVSVGTGNSDEPAEDLLIQLFRDDSLEAGSRAAVLAGCKDVYAQLLRWLASPANLEPVKWPDVATRLCRVVDIAAPPELGGRADAMLSLVLDNADVPVEVLTAAVRASMAYEQTEESIPRWKRLLDNPHVAAYAFNALLAINPRMPLIEAALKRLWKRQLLEGWSIDTAFLMRRAIRAQTSEEDKRSLIRGVLCELPSSAALWAKLSGELQRREWSRQWHRLVFEEQARRKVNLMHQQFQHAGAINPLSIPLDTQSMFFRRFTTSVKYAVSQRRPKQLDVARSRRNQSLYNTPIVQALLRKLHLRSGREIEFQGGSSHSSIDSTNFGISKIGYVSSGYSAVEAPIAETSDV